MLFEFSRFLTADRVLPEAWTQIGVPDRSVTFQESQGSIKLFSSKILATVAVVLSVSAMASCHRVKWSVSTKTTGFPALFVAIPPVGPQQQFPMGVH